MVSIVDAYDAITSQRCYDKARSTLDALSKLTAERNKQFDRKLVIRFVKAIGIYPIGSIAELSDGRIGIVLPTPEESRVRPRVLMVLDKQKKALEPFVLNLQTTEEDSNGAPLKIQRLLPDGSHNIAFKDYRQNPCFAPV